MAVSEELIELIEDHLQRFGVVTIKSMFGGAGMFRNGIMFGLISKSDILFFRTDDKTVGDFEAEDLKPFGHDHEKKSHMPYHQAPERVFDDPDEMLAWSKQAFEAAIRADNKKPASKRKFQQ